jgi:mono/diheme cytochrome c family protein
MPEMKKRTLVLTFLAGFAALTFALVFLLRNDEKPQSANEEVLSAEESPDWLFEASYIGPEACGECHTARFNKFRQTAHFKTALLPSETTILGKFTPEKSTLKTGNPNLRFEMQAREDGFYQTAILQTPNGIARRSEKIDFVIGSGKLGQTYLFWREYLLFQLPVSYLTATDEWVNSPGYPDGVADFNRPILPRCMECHSTFFQARSHQNNFYRKERYILGVTCERCHGPGSKHAEYHRQNPDDDEAQFIRFPGDFSRQRLLDLCSQCHAGQGVRLLKPPFSYRPGEDLSRYILLEDLDQQSQSGVHAANQVARLSKSECFQQNDSLTCISCHNPHALERGNLELFSKRCMKCHEPQVCGMSEKLGNKIRENCVDCHMPRVQDLKIDIETTGGFEFPIMPDHLIGIYPEISKRMLKRFSGNSE